MMHSRRSSNPSSKNIVNRITEVLNSYSECKKLRQTAGEKENVRTVTSNLASALDIVWQACKMVTWNYKLLTSVYKRKSKQNMRKISEELHYLLSKLIKNPSKIDEIDCSALDQINEKSSEIVQELHEVDRAIRAELDSVRKSILQKVEITEQILRIPDIAESVKDTQALRKCIDDIKTFLENSTIQGDLSELEALRQEWNRVNQEFQNYRDIESYEDLKNKHNFSDSTIRIIKALLEGKELSLYSIQPQVLEEMYTFEDFCKATTLKFRTGMEEARDEF